MSKPILRIDASSLKDSDCPRNFHLSNVLGYTEQTPSHKTEYGSALHLAAASLYRGDTPEVCLNKAIEYFMASPCDPGTDYRSAGHLMETTKDYLAYYAPKNETFKPLRLSAEHVAVELPFKIPFMSFPEVDVILCGVMDAIGHWGNTFCFKDIKTTGLSPNYFFDKWHTDIQMVLYSWTLKQLSMSEGYPPALIDAVFLSKTKPALFQRQLIDLQPDRVEETMDWVRERVTELVARYVNGNWKKNFTRCETKYGQCKFYNICKAPEVLGQNILDRHFKIRVYDPTTFGQQDH